MGRFISLQYHLLLLLLPPLLFHTIKAQTCNSPGGSLKCVCETSSGLKIDLTHFANDNGKDANLKTTFNGFEYLFNPCYGLEYNGGCPPGTALCQHESGQQARSCGTIESEQIIDELTYLVVRYAAGNGGRSSLVNLVCDQTAKTPIFTGSGDFNLQYEFNLKSECFCPGVRCSGGSSGGGTAPGVVGILLMFFFVAAVVGYFVFGTLLLHFHFKKTGLEMIPQKTFWFSLPGLIKDGCLFTFNPLIKLIKKDQSTESI